MKNIATLIGFVIFGALLAAGVPTFFMLACYLGTSGRTDGGWLGMIPQMALFGACGGFVMGIWLIVKKEVSK